MAFLTIHGIGEQKPGWAAKFHTELTKSLSSQTQSIKCFELEWQHLIEPNEETLSSEFTNERWKFSRKFALNYIGDAVAYAKGSVLYKNVHSEIYQLLNEINSWLEEDGKLYIIAHSLGTVMIFDYIYNIQNVNAMGNNIFRTANVNVIDKLECLFTFGSPLYIYSLQRNMGGNPIKVKKWINTYSNFDIIGYSVKKINTQFEQNWIIDNPILCGGLLSFWNPMSHIKYFDSNKVIKLIKKEVEKVAQALYLI